MINFPQTLEEARKLRYGWRYPENYIEGFCAYAVTHPHRQCGNSNGHGIAGLYCKQHAEIMDALLAEKRMKK